MANLLATLKLNLTYQGPGGGSISIPQKVYNVPYTADNSGHIDVPPATADGTTFPIPFGSIAEGVTLAMIINNTEQALELKVNGGAVVCEVAEGGAVVVCQDDLPGAVPITALSVLTTALTVGAGSVDFFVFGDPE